MGSTIPGGMFDVSGSQEQVCSQQLQRAYYDVGDHVIALKNTGEEVEGPGALVYRALRDASLRYIAASTFSTLHFVIQSSTFYTVKSRSM